jgi:hypothetical protein
VATYATKADLEAYVADNDAVSGLCDDDAVQRLLERAERRVDAALGPYVVDPDTGLKLDPGDLTWAQQQSLARATCAAAEHELVVGAELLTGEDDFAPPEVTVLRRAGRQAPKVLEELAGSGLLTFSGTVAVDEAA